MIRMSHEQFIGLCDRAGIKVDRISSTEVILKTSITAKEIDFDLFYPDSPYRTVRRALKEETPRLWMVKIIRAYTNFGLKDAIDFYNQGIENWIKSLVDTIPFEELPLLINEPGTNELYKQAVRNRLT